MNSDMKLIVGLGNPGKSFSNNRHNIGFMCVSFFAKAQGIFFDKKRGYARIGEGKIYDFPIIIARPQTYMNTSGKAVSALLKKFKLGTDDLVVIHDDLDLPLGRIRIRKGGSAGGHKGIQSIIGDIGTSEFVRVRIGIGRPPGIEGREYEKEIVDYVLSDFTILERPIVEEMIPRVSDALSCLLSNGLAKAMNKYNSAST
jgi:PTH1 family peptidyl-tRNA hydrolase